MKYSLPSLTWCIPVVFLESHPSAHLHLLDLSHHRGKTLRSCVQLPSSATIWSQIMANGNGYSSKLGCQWTTKLKAYYGTIWNSLFWENHFETYGHLNIISLRYGDLHSHTAILFISFHIYPIKLLQKHSQLAVRQRSEEHSAAPVGESR